MSVDWRTDSAAFAKRKAKEGWTPNFYATLRRRQELRGWVPIMIGCAKGGLVGAVIGISWLIQWLTR